jgi:hypothetical protein
MDLLPATNLAPLIYFLPSMYYPLKKQCRVILDSEKKMRGMRANLVARTSSKSVCFDSGHSVEKLILVC